MNVRYIVWVKIDGIWQENGEGPLTMNQAQRIANETRRECGCRCMVLPAGVEPKHIIKK